MYAIDARDRQAALDLRSASAASLRARRLLRRRESRRRALQGQALRRRARRAPDRARSRHRHEALGNAHRRSRARPTPSPARRAWSRARSSSATAAPNSGVRGYVSAYDAETGKLVWRFYTVPGDPSQPLRVACARERRRRPGTGKWWKVGGGGTVWDSMAYDPELDLLYVGAGNGSPWARAMRSPGRGDNLYLSSILALNPDTGELVWHYQTTPGDNWDYTATQHMILAELPIDGKPRKVIMQAPKNGFFYVLDRATGEFLSGRAVRTAHLGERTRRERVARSSRRTATTTAASSRCGRRRSATTTGSRWPSIPRPVSSSSRSRNSPAPTRWTRSSSSRRAAGTPRTRSTRTSTCPTAGATS